MLAKVIIYDTALIKTLTKPLIHFSRIFVVIVVAVAVPAVTTAVVIVGAVGFVVDAVTS